MSTLRDLIDSNRTLADATFAQAAAINKLVPVLDQLRHDVYDTKTDRETADARVSIALGKIDTALALVLDNIKDAKGDVRTLARDVTGAHPVPPPLPLLPEHSDSAALQVIKAIVAAPLTTKLSLILLCVLGLLIYSLVTGGLHGGG